MLQAHASVSNAGAAAAAEDSRHAHLIMVSFL